MLARFAKGCRSGIASYARAHASRNVSNQTSTSAKAAGEAAAGQAESTSGRLFENVKAPEEVSEHLPSEPSTIGRVASTIGNTLFLGTVGAAAFFGYYTLRYDNQQIRTMVEETQKPENSFPGSQVWIQLMRWYADKREHLQEEIKKYSDPPSDRLLPDLPPMGRHVRTLVLDLDDVLVHSDWTRARGWRTFKRPGAEDFIKQLAQFYELVVYTSQLPTYADPILDRLDPNRYIQFRLYRDSTQYTGGRHKRDLSKLNRDLSKVMFISADPEAALQPDNEIKLPPWKLEAEDTTLLDLLPFLEAIVRTNVADVRDVVKSYEGEHIPTAFRERMKKVQELQKQKAQQGKGFFGGLR